MKKMVSIIIMIILCMMELGLFLYFGLKYLDKDVIEKFLAAALSITALLCVVVSIWAILRTKNDLDGGLVIAFFMKTTIILVGIGTSMLDRSFEGGIYGFIVFGAGGVLTVCTGVLWCKDIYRPFSVKYHYMKRDSFHILDGYRAKDHLDQAASEYAEMLDKRQIDAFTDMEKRKLNEYAFMPGIYFLQWLIDREAMSPSFIQRVGQVNLEEVQKGNMPIMALLRQMDYTLSKDDAKPDMLRFMQSYFTDIKSDRIYYEDLERFYFDYYEVIRNPKRRVYCIDYSWEDYKKLSERIACRYSAYQEMRRGYIEERHNDLITWERFGCQLSVTIEMKEDRSINEALIAEAQHALNQLPDATIDAFFHGWDDYKEVEEIKNNCTSKEECYRKLLEIISIDELIVYESEQEVGEDEIGFVLCGEADFVEEDGISAVFRDGLLLEIGYRMDYSSPYSERNTMTYYTQKARKRLRACINSGIYSIDQLIQEGVLDKCNLIPTSLGGTSKEENICYLTPIACRRKETCDLKIEALLAFKVITDYRYELIYSKKSKSKIPEALKITAKNGKKLVFQHWIEVS